MDTMHNDLHKDIAFIQGMMEGSGQIDQRMEGKVLSRLLTLVDDLIEEVHQLNVRLSELEEYVEAVDEDLNELELLVYDDEEDEDENAGFFEMECPKCGEQVLIDDDIFDDDDTYEVLCPECHTVLLVNDDDESGRKTEESETEQMPLS